MNRSAQLQTVHIVFKTHLDIGFTDFSSTVTQQYFDYFIPAAIKTGLLLQDTGSDIRFIWTTGSWLIYEYLEQASASQRRHLERAIEAGIIRWHGLPFTTHTEYMDASLFEFGLSLSRSLDQRFGKKTIAAKMTDVPGHSIGMLPFLVQNGIELLHIGVNAVCTFPAVPSVFRWRHPDGSEIVVIYNSNYGGITTLPENNATLIVSHSNNETEQDNVGPHSVTQVHAVFETIRKNFPDARIIASDLSAFAHELRHSKHMLPIIEGELGDTWIHGVGSDPIKTAHFRELSRWRASRLARATSESEAALLHDFSRHLLMIPEHTWGLDIKKHLDDWSNYECDSFEKQRKSPRYQRLERSWSEQRDYIDRAIAVFDNTPWSSELTETMSALAPCLPKRNECEPIPNPADITETAHFQIAFDPFTGSITHLKHTATNTLLADENHQIGKLGYQSFSQKDYDNYLSQYHSHQTDWSIPDFSKPGLDACSAESRWWHPDSSAIFVQHTTSGWRFSIDMLMPPEASKTLGCPPCFTTELIVPDHEARIEISLQWMQKTATRLPEAIWYSMNPRVFHAHQWYLNKMGTWISPLEVVKNGNRSLHAVAGSVKYHDTNHLIEIATLDAPLVAPGTPALLRFDNRQPSMDDGIHFNLYNNIWGTNFPMWFDEGAKFRFQITHGL